MREEYVNYEQDGDSRSPDTAVEQCIGSRGGVLDTHPIQDGGHLWLDHGVVLLVAYFHCFWWIQHTFPLPARAPDFLLCLWSPHLRNNKPGSSSQTATFIRQHKFHNDSITTLNSMPSNIQLQIQVARTKWLTLYPQRHTYVTNLTRHQH